MVNRQLALDISLRDDVGFDSFVDGHNQQLVENLKRIATGQSGSPLLFLWGLPGSGKTHLLSACYRAALEHGKQPMYLALRDIGSAPGAESLLDDTSRYDLFCIDGLQHIAGQPAWEESLFKLCNRVRDEDKVLIVAGSCSPIYSGIGLRDLVTRLVSGLTYQVLPLADEHKINALRERAVQRGFQLSEEAAGYILRRCRRDTGHLFALLDRIDRASLEHKRIITIPFLRSLELD